jgi:PAS domain S-box-containing protein
MMERHAIIIADSDGIIRHWSEGAARLLGYAPAEAIGQKVDLVVPLALRDQHWIGFHRAMKSGHAGSGEFFDIPVLCRGGEEKAMRGQLHILVSESRHAIGAMAIFAAPA